ncbi:MAG: hypothetical protein NZM38_05085 [Cytophagales bacterium]|nr:hypothetical protein [Cytophagales bacterium]MDW8384127.1 hypothetical protein [Flammeovirgaceae bacterium]
MDLINELVFVLGNNKSTSFELLIPKKSKIRQLYHLAEKQKVYSDDEAAQIIYGTDGKSKKYLMLKKHLISKLCELVILTEKSSSYESDSYLQIYHECRNLLVVSRKLLLLNVYHNAESILFKVRKKAQFYELLEIEKECLLQLRNLYTLKGFAKETQNFHKELLQKCVQLQKWEEMEGIYEIFQSQRKFSLGVSPEQLADFDSFTEKILMLNSQVNTSHSKFLQLKFLRFMHHTKGEWKDVMIVNYQIKELLLQYPYLRTNASNLEYEYFQAFAHWGLQQYADSEIHFKNALKWADYRAFNKFEVMEIGFRIYMHTFQWKDAGKILQSVRKQPQFQYLDERDIALWRLRELWFFLGIQISPQKEELIREFIPAFEKKKVWAFLSNELSSLAKDKQGSYLSFLLAKFVWDNLHCQDLPEVESLSVYYQRYIKNLKNYERTKIFVRSLLKKSKFENSHEWLQENLLMLKNLPYCEHIEWLSYNFILELIS